MIYIYDTFKCHLPILLLRFFSETKMYDYVAKTIFLKTNSVISFQISFFSLNNDSSLKIQLENIWCCIPLLNKICVKNDLLELKSYQIAFKKSDTPFFKFFIQYFIMKYV